MDIKKFDMQNVKPGKVILAVGKRNTGKSTIIIDIVNQLKDKIPCAVVVSGSEDGNGFYKNYFPDLMIHSEYDVEILQKLIVRQKKVIKRVQNGENINTNCLLILDDCGYDRQIYKTKPFRAAVYNGRHLSLTVILALQYITDIPADIRTNIDFIFALRENILTNKERLYRFFFGIFPDFYTFTQCFGACTSNFECLICDNTSRSNEISECIYWYKAPIHPIFRFGHPDFWKLAEKYYNEEFDDDIEDSFEEKRKYKSKHPKIVVKKLE